MSSDERFDDIEAELRALAGSLDVLSPAARAGGGGRKDQAGSPAAGQAEAAVADRRGGGGRPGRRHGGHPAGQAGGDRDPPLRRDRAAARRRHAGSGAHAGAAAGEREVPPDEVAGQVAFPVRTLAALGEPERVTVADGGRVVSMFWPDGIRLDQFDGRMDPFFFKRLGPPFPDEVEVDGVTGFWLPGSHPLGYITREGAGRCRCARPGPPSSGRRATSATGWRAPRRWRGRPSWLSSLR
ncbi:hypothetical protein ACFSTC_51850 [Nonomuraea ferruginea]